MAARLALQCLGACLLWVLCAARRPAALCLGSSMAKAAADGVMIHLGLKPHVAASRSCIP